MNSDVVITRPRASLAHLPTPLELMPNLSRYFGAGNGKAYVKRDDCTGLALGGNKARQLEYYLGEAAQKACDTILITGAVQSNYVRMAAAAARKLSMECHIQLEQRVVKNSKSYHHSGNVLLDRLLSATIHFYPHGEDEAGADHNLEQIADQLRSEGKNPYVIHLSPDHPPLGALGYVEAAGELLQQADAMNIAFDAIVVPSGSGITHAGMLFGLRLYDCQCEVIGVCVRRPADQQYSRIVQHCKDIAELLKIKSPVNEDDITLSDELLAPGYGCLNNATRNAMAMAAKFEGLILDPVYSGKTMAEFLQRLAASRESNRLLFLHTGGTPALFAYGEEMISEDYTA